MKKIKKKKNQIVNRAQLKSFSQLSSLRTLHSALCFALLHLVLFTAVCFGRHSSRLALTPSPTHTHS